MKNQWYSLFPLCIPPTPGQNLPSVGFLFLFLAISECAARPRLSMRLLWLASMSWANPRKIYKGWNQGKRKEIEGQPKISLWNCPSIYNPSKHRFFANFSFIFSKIFLNFFHSVHFPSLVYIGTPIAIHCCLCQCYGEPMQMSSLYNVSSSFIYCLHRLLRCVPSSYNAFPMSRYSLSV